MATVSIPSRFLRPENTQKKKKKSGHVLKTRRYLRSSIVKLVCHVSSGCNVSSLCVMCQACHSGCFLDTVHFPLLGLWGYLKKMRRKVSLQEAFLARLLSSRGDVWMTRGKDDWTDGPMDEKTGRWMNERMKRVVGRRLNERMDRWVGRLVDEQRDKWI